MDKQKLTDILYDILNDFYYEDVDGVHFNYPQTVDKIIELIDKEKSECKDKPWGKK